MTKQPYLSPPEIWGRKKDGGVRRQIIETIKAINMKYTPLLYQDNQNVLFWEVVKELQEKNQEIGIGAFTNTLELRFQK